MNTGLQTTCLLGITRPQQETHPQETASIPLWLAVVVIILAGITFKKYLLTKK